MDGHNRVGPRSALLAAALLAVSLVAIPAAAAPLERSFQHDRLSTPQLIERARARGDLSRFRADLFLAYAFADHERLPEVYRSHAPWDGTVPLLRLYERIAKMPSGPRRSQLESTIQAAPDSCSNEKAPSNQMTSSHFRIDYASSIGGGLTISDYVTSLETAWTREITTFGWAAPPLHPSLVDKYHVIVTSLSPGLYGFVSPIGTYAAPIGDNPNTAWTEPDAYASCMALSSDYSGFPSPPQASLDSTTGHEFNHSIQFGYGAITGSNRPDDSFIEGGATWMEDESFDTANDNYNYLWPAFEQDMGQYADSPYPYWITFRGITERYGTGNAGGGEQVMQDFWEEVSKETNLGLNALNHALGNRGTNLADAYHAYAIAVKFSKPCGGLYVLPYCFEEGAGYVAEAGLPTLTGRGGTIATVGNDFSGSVRDNYALNWVALPTGSTSYGLSLENTSTGGQLRATIACDTGSALILTPMPAVVGAGAVTGLSSYDPTGCTSVVGVITNQSQTAADPTSAGTARTYTLSTIGQEATLTVNKAGSGTGTVTSDPAGINCGIDCSETYSEGTPVILTASASADSVFTGWSGACTGAGTCDLTMSSNKSVTATFELLRTLSVSNAGSGTGTVTSDPAGINCGLDCSQSYVDGTEVTLTATPDGASTFDGWNGDCAGTDQCIVTMDAAKSVSATFTEISTPTHSLTVTKSGSGSGTVASSPAGINCGLDCSQTYGEGTAVTLTAMADDGSTFAGWSGGCTGAGDCIVTMNADETATATFDDSSPPTVPVLATLTPFRTAKQIPLSWTPSSDPESAVTSYAIDKRVAPPNGTLGPWQNAATTADTSVKMTGIPGSGYCFRVRAVNGAGLSSAASSRVCTTLPLDDRALSSVGKWSRKTGSGYYLNTYLRGVDRGATLKKQVTAKRLALVATRCPKCGTVKVFLGKQLLRKIRLGAATTRKKRVIAIATFTKRRTGTVRIKIISGNKPVLIDGLGAGAI